MNCTRPIRLILPPPRDFVQPKLVPVVLKLKDVYGVWQSLVPHIPKASRFTLGSKIDAVFLNAIEYCFLARYSREAEKLSLIDRCSAHIDLLKLLFLFLLSVETKAISVGQYAHIAEPLSDVGRMLGGWRRQVVQKNPALAHGTGKS
jgi:hypothetical protein